MFLGKPLVFKMKASQDRCPERLSLVPTRVETKFETLTRGSKMEETASSSQSFLYMSSNLKLPETAQQVLLTALLLDEIHDIIE